MSVRIKRGIDANRISVVPDIGEPLFATDTKKLYIGDGVTPGGVAVDVLGSSAPVTSVAGRIGDVALTKSDVGLSNVNNTTDSAKPISTATQTALDTKANTSALSTIATTGSYNDLTGKPAIPAAQVNADWGASNGAAQILNKPAFSTVATSGSYADLSNKPTIPDVTTKADKTYVDSQDTALQGQINSNSTAISGKQSTLVSGTNIKTINGTTLLGSGDIAIAGGTSSDATTTAKGIIQLAGDLSGTAAAPTIPGLATKEPTVTAGTTAQYYRGDKSFQTLDKTAVGLGNVDNTSDLNKPVSTAQAAADALALPLAGGTMTGAVTVSTAAKNGIVVVDSTASSTANVLLQPVGTNWEFGARGSSATYPNSLYAWNGSYRFVLNSTGLALGDIGTSLPPTHTLTLPSTATGIALYNTSDQTTNYERVRHFWSGNAYVVSTEKGGTSAVRGMQFTAFGGTTGLIVGSSSAGGMVSSGGDFGSAGGYAHRIFGQVTASSGVQYGLGIMPTISQTATAGYTALLINPSQTSVGSGPKLLLDAQVGGSSKVSIDNTGIVQIANTTAPAGTPSTSGYLYVEAGALKFKGSSGTVTVVAPA